MMINSSSSEDMQPKLQEQQDDLFFSDVKRSDQYSTNPKSVQKRKCRAKKARLAGEAKHIEKKFQDVTDGDLCEKILLNKEHFPRTATLLQLGQNALDTCLELTGPMLENQKSRIRGPVIGQLIAGIPRVDQAMMLNMSQKAVADVCRTSGGWSALQSESRALGKRGEYGGDPERDGIVKDVKRICNEGRSSTLTKICKFSRHELWAQYAKLGVVRIYLELATTEPFQTALKHFTPLLPTVQQHTKERNLLTALWYAREWKSQGFVQPRPPQIWYRSERKFWQILSRQAARRTTRFCRCFSEKLHPRPLCQHATDTFSMCEKLLVKIADAHAKEKKEEEKELEARMGPVRLKIRKLQEHLEKYRIQRAANQELQANLKNFPGVAIVYEDFGSCYQADNDKMLDLIITIMFWDEESKEVKVIYYDTFSRGSLLPEEINNTATRGQQDQFMYREAWRALHESGVFEKFKIHTVSKSGDNGGSLKSYGILWMHSFLTAEYGVRVVFNTLCEHHAYNRCDAHIGVLGRVFYGAQRKTGSALGTPTAHAEFVNERCLKNTGRAKAIEVTRAYDALIPDGLLGKDYQVWGLQNCCVVYPESPNILDNNPDPTTSIVWPGLTMSQPHLDKKEVAFLCFRSETAVEEENCKPCTNRFGRFVLKKEHDQSRHYFCEVTRVWRMENKNRMCLHCNKYVLTGHTRGKNHPCPSANRSEERMFHMTFSVKGNAKNSDSICQGRPCWCFRDERHAKTLSQTFKACDAIPKEK